jgi:dTDP-4-dehydrorhamnose reductase
VNSAVFVLGHRGMLGRVVRRYLAEQGCRVTTTDQRFVGGSDDPLIEEVVRGGADVVVNCAGAVPSRVTDRDEMIRSNALLPQQLAARLESGQVLIHASSDGVFDGSRGPYVADDVPDAIDTYGMSKRLGELAMHLTSAIVVRTSIVGTGGGLLGWLLDQHDDVEGYTNHLWSGVTTLEWARVCSELINDVNSRSFGIVHLASQQAVSKHVLLETAAQIFGSPIRVRPTVAKQSINRALTPTIQRMSIQAQLEELRDWESRGT